MPSLLKSLPNPFSSKSPGTRPPSAHPIQIRNQFYKGIREFTAWEPWGTPPDHNKNNLNYIPVKDAFVKQFNYPVKLQQLIDFGWKTASKPANGARGGSGILAGNQRVAPGQQIDLTKNEPMNPLRRNFGHAIQADWEHVTKFEQVCAYTFRGDTRPPEAILAAGGYFPPSQRQDSFYQETIATEFYLYMKKKQGLDLDNDPPAKADFLRQVQTFIRSQGHEDSKLFAEYHFWRTVLDNEQMHLKGMTNNSFLKGYISTTRDIQVAKEASSGTLGGVGVNQTAFGWVYVLKVESGFLLKHGIGGVSKKEGEIANLGPVSWKNIYGFIGRSPTERTIYIRNMFDQQDFNAFKLVLASLSTLA